METSGASHSDFTVSSAYHGHNVKPEEPLAIKTIIFLFPSVCFHAVISK